MKPHTHANAGQPVLTALTDHPHAPTRLLCIGPAGSTPAFYRPLAQRLPPNVDLHAVNLPGRGHLADQPPLTDPRQMPRIVADAIRHSDDDRPFALFGHSLGALLAYETARTLHRASCRPPVLLALSALPAVHNDSLVTMLTPLFLDSRQGLAHILGALPDDLPRDRRILKAAIPFVADLLMALQYRHLHEPPLDLPLAVYGGRDDPLVRTDDLDAWSDLVLQPVTVRLFPGTHTYPTHQAGALAERLVKDLHAARRYTTGRP
ncbi:thioesterase [Streptomyces sp. Tu 2975]|uniref:thioesterase II family protein n=1 Tax=Streptomyces sp. Tu 2975 TaxID=2676871 RepID=UPI001358CF90|nr:alpha/beta fold hydrolase [Streptomyces sp. Tu 2975]QIP83374.1 thioesterase [Streptomyces sp. Tu 2975]